MRERERSREIEGDKVFREVGKKRGARKREEREREREREQREPPNQKPE